MEASDLNGRNGVRSWPIERVIAVLVAVALGGQTGYSYFDRRSIEGEAQSAQSQVEAVERRARAAEARAEIARRRAEQVEAQSVATCDDIGRVRDAIIEVLSLRSEDINENFRTQAFSIIRNLECKGDDAGPGPGPNP